MVPAGYLIVPGGYLVVPGGYLSVPGGYLMVPGGYLNKGVIKSCFGQLKRTNMSLDVCVIPYLVHNLQTQET